MGASTNADLKVRPPVPRVILVTDGRRLSPGAPVAERLTHLERQAREAFAAGVDAVQIREDDLDAAALLALTRAIASHGRAIVTERADVAIAAGASGVHLKAAGAAAGRVRAILPPHMTLSRAVHGVEDAVRSGSDAALDWLLAGTAFPSVSKPGGTSLGAAGVRALAHASRLPIVAIGGITGENAPELLAAGAAGVAGIGLFLARITTEHVDRLRRRY